MDNFDNTYWPLWRKIVFRFLFIYLVLETAPITWLDSIPYLSLLTRWYSKFTDWIVIQANAMIFHVRPVLVPENGSGDTSMGWARLWTYLCLGFIGAILWSVLDKKRPNYTHLNYWLCLFARYFVLMVALSYGIIKLFGQQMDFPNLHQLDTPLGDLLPMRFSWFFIGYSRPYRFFSGMMEVIAALLLLNRRTVSLGVLVATGVFINVMMLNLCYDIPVKIFSMQMVFTCLVLLANESGRLINFFILNKPAPLSEIYHFRYTKKWMKVSRIALKSLIILLALVLPFYESYSQYLSPAANRQPVKNGVYAVTTYRLNNKELPLSILDTIRWQDLVFEDGLGSVKSGDTVFRQRYKRGYFTYGVDTANRLITFKKNADEMFHIGEFKYTMPDSNTITLDGLMGKDSLYVLLTRTKRHFQLAERQFHWLSESNR
jgi:hypothetical protein